MMNDCAILKQAELELFSLANFICSILYCQNWRSYARRNLRSGEYLFVRLILWDKNELLTIPCFCKYPNLEALFYVALGNMHL